ncbi:nucleotide-diphosphate-sugar epimerase [Cellulomonas chitinilytica]|uniref:Nucleotide-diphosphate-sugar epimerase n=1 Tax=Cellulomonas chitinilytica TaxID=398759 RepID=A0A919U257_9CELL|nr:SDR family oxidoreductase [Cellulomonas chitinilytica]GIG20799.1 nucleotide-diphosphate-sugar epimerase [Cellulomonas chitinilytica]
MPDDARPVLVTGGTGTLGRALVRTLLDDGRAVRVLSRREPTPAAPQAVDFVTGDLLTGEGVREAVAGVSAVVHCASDPRHPDRDLDAAAQLLLAARAAQVPHLVYISIVGVDRVPLGYYKIKHEVEDLVENAGVPWTILRATQFHDLVATMLGQLAKAPVVVVPDGLLDQPVDVREVARRLADLARQEPQGRVPDLGGPQVLTVAELARTYLTATGRRRPVWSVPLVLRATPFRDNGHLAREHAVGRTTFAEWVQQRTGSPAA